MIKLTVGVFKKQFQRQHYTSRFSRWMFLFLSQWIPLNWWPLFNSYLFLSISRMFSLLDSLLTMTPLNGLNLIVMHLRVQYFSHRFMHFYPYILSRFYSQISTQMMREKNWNLFPNIRAVFGVDFDLCFICWEIFNNLVIMENE